MPAVSNKALEAQKVQDVNDARVEGQSKDAQEWAWVRIPTRDITDYPFDGVCVNFLHFGPINASNRKCDCGDSPQCQTTGIHKIPARLAPEVLERLRIFQEQCVKVYSSRVNLKALQELAVSSPGYMTAIQEFEKAGLNQ